MLARVAGDQGSRALGASGGLCYSTMLVSESYKVSIEICIISLLLFTISNSTLVKKDSS